MDPELQITELEVSPIRVVGRYAIYEKIASGGMATVHIGRLSGAVGFARTVAIKVLHPGLARDPEFVSMFVDEARLAARIRHPNVVQTLDVVSENGELFLVMEYVQGEPLSRLMKLAHVRKESVPIRIAAALMSGTLQGLHAAHETKTERGQPLLLVHRDVSPQNVMVGVDGLARVLDFGVARAAGAVHTSQVGRLKGKIAYMAPEQLQGGEVTRQADIYSASVVAWELLTGTRLFRAETQSGLVAQVQAGKVLPPSQVTAHVPPEFDPVILKGLARAPEDRYQSALEMALALEACAGVEPPRAVAAWIEEIAGGTLNARADRVASVERSGEVSDVSQLRAIINELATGNPSSPSIHETPSPVAPRARVKWLSAAAVALAGLLVLGLVLLLRPGSSESHAANAEPKPKTNVGTTNVAAASPARTATDQSQGQGAQDHATGAAPAPSSEAAPITSAPPDRAGTRPSARATRSGAAREPSGRSRTSPGKSPSPFSGLGGRL
jgi:serine/threonine-protein kinase